MSQENRIITNQQFYGGNASDEAIGTAASFGYSRAIDHRKNPSQLSVLPGARKISGAIVTDLILNMVQATDGSRYAYGQTGKFYKISTSNVVTLVSTLPSGSDGMLFRSDSDAIYCATQTDVRRLYPVTGGAGTFDQTYGASKSIDAKAFRTDGGQNYGVLGTLSEATIDKATFQPDIEPFYSIKVNLVTKGTGNLILTLHDGLNSQLSQVTIPNASLAVGLIEFIFPNQVRALVKPNARTYHFHVNGGSGHVVRTAAANDFSSPDFELWARRLVDPVNDLHPMAQFLQYTLIGNGNYLAVHEPLSPSDPPNTEFQRHRLVFPSGFEVCGIAVTDEFAVIACERRSSDGTKDFQEGKLFIWDGFGTTYNQVVDISGGSPEGIQSHENYPHFFVNGTLCAWPGGKNIIKIRKVANTDTMFSGILDATRVYPNMMTVRNNMLHAAYPSVTNNLGIEHGVHTWGTLENNYPATWGNLNYAISTGTVLRTVSNNLELGMIKNFGDEMYVSWRDGANYGLDIVDSLCKPAPVAKWRSLRFDAGAAYKEKRAEMTKISTRTLPVGVTITPTLKVDDGAETVLSEFTMIPGDRRILAVVPLDKKIFETIITGFDITCSSATTESPVIKANSLAWNPQSNEKAF